MIVKDKKFLIVGVANKSSIAWAIAEALLREGAQVALTYQGERLKVRVEALVKETGKDIPLIDMDVTLPETVDAAVKSLEARWGSLDGLVHSIAFAPKDDLSPGITKTSLESWNTAMQISSFSLLQLCNAFKGMLEKSADGGSVITLTYDTLHVYPNYNLMAIAKSALEASMRYAAWDLGRGNIRVNAISAGPIKTLAARGISGFSKMLDEGEKKSPLNRNVTVEEVGNTGLFLLSSMGSGITGQVIYVDAGQSIMGVSSEG